MTRVVITGMGVVSPIGNSLEKLFQSLLSGRSGVVQFPEWKQYDSFGTQIGGPVEELDEKIIPRKIRRSMGLPAVYTVHAAEQAIQQAKLTPKELTSLSTGVSIGSTIGSPMVLQQFFNEVKENNGFSGQKSGVFPKFMSHTCAANLAIYYGIRGRVQAPCSACTSGSQGIGLGYEAVKHGYSNVMICGGSDELHYTSAGIFDILQSASTHYNDQPNLTPRPFDVDRDGIVASEGSGVLILESLDSALARNANILGEILGYTSTCDGTHITTPSQEGIESCIALSLEQVKLKPEDIDFINAHATGTQIGDRVEGLAYKNIFKASPPIVSFKSYMGHSFGASGAIEAIISFLMMKESIIPPTLNLKNIDPELQGLDLVTKTREKKMNIILSNNFAFGGINTSLILSKYHG